MTSTFTGSTITQMLSRIFPFSNNEQRALILGNDGSGKTALLYQWCLGELVTTMPTIGFNVESVQHRRINFTMWDVGGCDKIRPLWRHYFHNTQAIVYVVDSFDVERLVNDNPSNIYDVSASSGLRFISEEPELRDAVILILANKQDLPGALSVEEISSRLSLDTALPGRVVHIQGCSALTREGIMEGLDWLHDTLLHPPDPPLSGAPPPPPPPPSGGGGSGSSGGQEDGSDLSPAEQEARRLEALLLEWLERPDLPSNEFLLQLEEATLDVWDHYTHLRIAWLFLTKHGRRVGMEKIFSSIESFIKRSPRTKRSDTSRGTTFHETMTYFWVHMVHYAMVTMQTAVPRADDTTTNESGVQHVNEIAENDEEESLRLSFKKFLLMNPQLVNGGLFLHYYSKQRILMNAEARSAVLLPDIRPLPSVVSGVSSNTEGRGIAAKLSAATPVHLRLQPRAPLNDLDFLLAIKQGSYQSWGHDILIRVIFVLLLEQEKKADAASSSSGGRPEPTRNVDQIFDMIKIVEGDNFHITLNYFWIQMVSYHIALIRKKRSQVVPKSKKLEVDTTELMPETDEKLRPTCVLDFEDFYRQPDCQRLRNSLLYEKYYSRSIVDSRKAMESVELPNLKQLPSVIS